MKIQVLLAFVMSLMLLTSCQNEFSSESKFYAYWNDEDNGYTREKKHEAFKFRVKYFPTEILAYEEARYEPNQKEVYDRLLKEYGETMTFRLTIEMNNDAFQQNPVMYNLSSWDEYQKRVIDLNFNTADFIKLKTDKGEFYPLLSNMENTYHLEGKKSITLVFGDTKDVKGLLESTEFDLVFNDQVFRTGINHFGFERKTLNQALTFNFIH